MDLKNHAAKAKLARKRQHKFLDRIKKRPPKDLDTVVMGLDEEVFQEVDCLECANCCSTISPTFTQKDVERIGSALKMKPGEVIGKYLRIDEDNDLVLKSVPCPFLGSDNYCSIYESRPRACRDYPHTGKRKFHLHIGITKKNTMVCPAAFRIVERMEKIYS